MKRRVRFYTLPLLLASGCAAAMQPLDDGQLESVSGAGIGFFLDGFLYDKHEATARIEGFKDSAGNPVVIHIEDAYVKGQGSQRGSLDTLASIGSPLHPFRLGIVGSSQVASLPVGVEALQLRTPTWTDPLNDTHQYGLWSYYQGCLYGEAGCTNPDLAVTNLDVDMALLTARQNALRQRYAGVGFLTLQQEINADMVTVQGRQQAVDTVNGQYISARTTMTNLHDAARDTGIYPKPALGEKYWCGTVCIYADVRDYNASVDSFMGKSEELMDAYVALSEAWRVERYGLTLTERAQDYNEFSSLCGVPSAEQPACSAGRITKLEGDRASLVLVASSLKDGKTRVPGLDIGFGSVFSLPSTAWSGSSGGATQGVTTTRSDFFSLHLEGFTLHGSYLNIWGNADGLVGEVSMQLYADKLIAGACRTCTDANRLVAKNVYFDLNLGHGRLQPLNFSVLADGELRFRLPGVTWANHQQFYAQVPKSNISIGNLSLSNVNLGSQAVRGLRIDYLDMRTINLPR
ncbi:MAG TPA: hypothetical protein VL178_05050 [Pseudomonas sp.]|nr:hypothetical protein [Pseudomonas sp.]